MQIIEYREKYKQQIIELLVEVAVNEYGFKEWEKWFRLFTIDNYIKNGGNCWIAINDEDKVIGTISLRKIDNITAEVKYLYIKKSERRKGISSLLMMKLIEYANSNNYQKLQLDTYKEFKEAIFFYEKFGFKVKEKIENKFIYEKWLEDIISIIVPIYNVEKYLKYCLDGILKQSYKNLEIILVDDGSTDRCGQICDEYAMIDERIKVIHKPNAGLADARNTGLKYAIGNYIGFIDSDDYIYPSFYEELFALIKKYNADIAECEFKRINESNIENCKEILNNENEKRIIVEKEENNTEALELLYGPRLQPYIKKVVVWNKLYKKDLLDNVSFPVGKLHEDEYTTFQIINKAKKIISTNRVLHGYIQTNNSIMRQEIKQKRIEDNLDAYIKSSDYFSSINEEIEVKSRRRYLENCIELAGKVYKSNGKEKEVQISFISNLYKDNYDLYIDKINKLTFDKREKEIIKLLTDAYEDMVNNKILSSNYWDKLEILINKE